MLPNMLVGLVLDSITRMRRASTWELGGACTVVHLFIVTLALLLRPSPLPACATVPGLWLPLPQASDEPRPPEIRKIKCTWTSSWSSRPTRATGFCTFHDYTRCLSVGMIHDILVAYDFRDGWRRATPLTGKPNLWADPGQFRPRRPATWTVAVACGVELHLCLPL